MKDRFKFRFWHKSKNRYVNTEKLVLNDGTYTQVGTKQMNNGTYCSYIVNEYNTSEIIPEQCTGLKDKNGKLIYEGDIVVTRLNRKGFVLWNEVCFCYRTLDKAGCTYIMESETEVIGNIHENADLLENKKE